MNLLQQLSSQPWALRLGWTLVHFLWQGLMIAGIYAGVRRIIATGWTPNARYVLACAALAVLFAAPVATCIITLTETAPDPAYRIHAVPPAQSIDAKSAIITFTRSADEPEQFLSWIVAAWLLGATALWVRLAGGFLLTARMQWTQVRPAPPEWQARLERLGARFNLVQPVRLMLSAQAHAPVVVGWIRPAILVPVGVLGGVPAGYLDALLLHELAHIRRHDYLVNILQSAAEALLFYHPAVWWVSGHIRAERELCCDDLAVAATGDPVGYARALVHLESGRPASLRMAVAANGASLPDRIARLLGVPRPAPPVRGAAAVPIAILLLIAAYGLFGQQAERPEFQVASIKRNTEPRPRGMIVRPQPGGRLTATNAPLMMLIQSAYSVGAFQIAGGPAWINTDGYDIEAKPEKETDRTRMWLMVQSLLADRFQLKLHRETRELPVYALTAARNGAKLPSPKDGDCVPEPRVLPPEPQPGMAQICGRPRIVMGPEGLRIEGDKTAMPEFVRILSIITGRPVEDRTGIAAEFDVRLNFTPDESTAGLPGAGGPGDPGGPRPASDPDKPNIFSALQEQLGLKLATSKGPVEVLVIDHVERPAAN